MALRLTKATDAAHKRLSILIFGEPKVGKTTLAKTLPVSSDDKLFYVAADPGQLALRDRGFIVAQPSNETLDEAFFNEVLDHIRQHGNDYEWIFVDGVDEVADAVLRSKMKTQRDGRKAYGEMADYMELWLKAIRDVQGVSVVFVTHIEQRDAGDGNIEYIPMFPGKQIQNHVNEWFDLIGCARLVRSGDNNYKRFIQFRREADWRYAVGDRSGVADLYEEPDLGALAKKIHAAGFETKGQWKEPKVSDTDLKAFAAGKPTTEIDAIKAQAQEKYGKGIRELTIAEFTEFTQGYKGENA